MTDEKPYCARCKAYIEGHELTTISDGLYNKEVLRISENTTQELPVCAFDKDGNFQKENWMCMTMIGLRDMSSYHGWNEDESIDVVHTLNGEYVVLTYYKHRGRTGNALVLCDDEQRNLTLKDAERLLEVD